MTSCLAPCVEASRNVLLVPGAGVPWSAQRGASCPPPLQQQFRTAHCISTPKSSLLLPSRVPSSKAGAEMTMVLPKPLTRFFASGDVCSQAHDASQTWEVRRGSPPDTRRAMEVDKLRRERSRGGATQPGFGHVWSEYAGFGPRLAKVRPNFANVRCIRCEFGTHRPNLVEFLGPACEECAEILPKGHFQAISQLASNGQCGGDQPGKYFSGIC